MGIAERVEHFRSGALQHLDAEQREVVRRERALPALSGTERAELDRDAEAISVALGIGVTEGAWGLVESAARSWPLDEPLLAVDLPERTGFIVLPGDDFFRESAAYSWDMSSGGVLTVAAWDYIGVMRGLWSREFVTHYQLGDAMRRTEQGGTEVLTRLFAALRIAQSPALAPVGEAGTRRSAGGLAPRRVTVLDLRPRAVGCRDQEGSSGRALSHRYLRRGHWRKQPFKREDGTWDRRRQWIHPTVVGDESLPFIDKTRIYAVRAERRK